MNSWDDLPNGKKIDEVLEFVRCNPNAPWDATQDEPLDLARTTARDAAGLTAWDAAGAAAGVAVRGEAGVEAAIVAQDAALALADYDYAGELYDAELDVVELAAHAGDPAAVLLLPMLKIIKHTKEKP